LNTLFQIDFEVIRIMRSKNFNFSFAENVSEFVILRRDIGKIRSFCKFLSGVVHTGVEVCRMDLEMSRLVE